MPPIDLRQVRSEIRLSVVLDLLGWRARERSGEQVRGRCPVHGSASPTSRSFSAHLGRDQRGAARRIDVAGSSRCLALSVKQNQNLLQS